MAQTDQAIELVNKLKDPSETFTKIFMSTLQDILKSLNQGERTEELEDWISCVLNYGQEVGVAPQELIFAVEALIEKDDPDTTEIKQCLEVCSYKSDPEHVITQQEFDDLLDKLCFLLCAKLEDIESQQESDGEEIEVKPPTTIEQVETDKNGNITKIKTVTESIKSYTRKYSKDDDGILIESYFEADQNQPISNNNETTLETTEKTNIENQWVYNSKDEEGGDDEHGIHPETVESNLEQGDNDKVDYQQFGAAKDHYESLNELNLNKWTSKDGQKFQSEKNVSGFTQNGLGNIIETVTRNKTRTVTTKISGGEIAINQELLESKLDNGDEEIEQGDSVRTIKVSDKYNSRNQRDDYIFDDEIINERNNIYRSDIDASDSTLQSPIEEYRIGTRNQIIAKALDITDEDDRDDIDSAMEVAIQTAIKEKKEKEERLKMQLSILTEEDEIDNDIKEHTTTTRTIEVFEEILDENGNIVERRKVDPNSKEAQPSQTIIEEEEYEDEDEQENYLQEEELNEVAISKIIYESNMSKKKQNETTNNDQLVDSQDSSLKVSGETIKNVDNLSQNSGITRTQVKQIQVDRPVDKSTQKKVVKNLDEGSKNSEIFESIQNFNEQSPHLNDVMSTGQKFTLKKQVIITQTDNENDSDLKNAEKQLRYSDNQNNSPHKIGRRFLRQGTEKHCQTEDEDSINDWQIGDTVIHREGPDASIDGDQISISKIANATTQTSEEKKRDSRKRYLKNDVNSKSASDWNNSNTLRTHNGNQSVPNIQLLVTQQTQTTNQQGVNTLGYTESSRDLEYFQNEQLQSPQMMMNGSVTKIDISIFNSSSGLENQQISINPYTSTNKIRSVRENSPNFRTSNIHSSRKVEQVPVRGEVNVRRTYTTPGRVRMGGIQNNLKSSTAKVHNYSLRNEMINGGINPTTSRVISKTPLRTYETKNTKDGEVHHRTPIRKSMIMRNSQMTTSPMSQSILGNNSTRVVTSASQVNYHPVIDHSKFNSKVIRAPLYTGNSTQRIIQTPIRTTVNKDIRKSEVRKSYSVQNKVKVGNIEEIPVIITKTPIRSNILNHRTSMTSSRQLNGTSVRSISPMRVSNLTNPHQNVNNVTKVSIVHVSNRMASSPNHNSFREPLTQNSERIPVQVVRNGQINQFNPSRNQIYSTTTTSTTTNNNTTPNRINYSQKQVLQRTPVTSKSTNLLIGINIGNGDIQNTMVGSHSTRKFYQNNQMASSTNIIPVGQSNYLMEGSQPQNRKMRNLNLSHSKSHSSSNMGISEFRDGRK